MKMTTTQLNKIVNKTRDEILDYQIKALLVRNGKISTTPDERERLNEMIDGRVRWWYNIIFEDLKPMMFDQLYDHPYDIIDNTKFEGLWIPLCTTYKGSFVH